jgi:hypothetical protein
LKVARSTRGIRSREEAKTQAIPVSTAQLIPDAAVQAANSFRLAIWKSSEFGLNGSINTPEACSAVGGRFFPHLAGWMTHVYPLRDRSLKDLERGNSRRSREETWINGRHEDVGPSGKIILIPAASHDSSMPVRRRSQLLED